jgi:hypothetical protein
MFETTKTLPRAGRLAKLTIRGRRTLVREVTKNPVVTLTGLSSLSMEMGEPSKRATISAAFHKSGLYGRVASLNTKRHIWRRPGTIPTMKHGGGSKML